jgi:Flp pilus assembly protein TadD
MKSMALNFAASSLVLGIATVGCVANGVGTSPAAASERGDQQASQLFEQASQALARGNLAGATTMLERAVALSPRDAGYRMMLADAYMKGGRFQSAESTYRDVLTIDPGRTRAALSLALMQVANGRQQEAMAQLEQIEGSAAPADVGLAYALAGSPQRAIDLLEPAARAPGANSRVRQNLALAYALGGDWQRSRTVAAQDVAPGELRERMTQWASLAQRAGTGEQVAAMLGVSPASDPGQPVQLALNTPVQVPVAARAPVQMAAALPTDEEIPMPADANAQAPVQAPIAFAAADPAVAIHNVPAAPVAAPAPIESPVVLAAAQDIPAPVQAPAPTVSSDAAADAGTTDYAELEQAEWGIDERGSVQLPDQPAEAREAPVPAQYAAAAETLVRPDPVVMPVRSRAVRALSVASRVMSIRPLNSVRSASGNYVVQIGAFSSPINAERAWQQAERRFGLKDEQPVTMTIDVNGRLLHRVAISGFEKRRDAVQACATIHARGGECFVRDSQGDASVRWAARYSRNG